MMSNSADAFTDAVPLNGAVVAAEQNHLAQPDAIVLAAGRTPQRSGKNYGSRKAARRSVPVRAPGLTLRDLAIDRSRCGHRSGLSSRIVELIGRRRSAPVPFVSASAGFAEARQGADWRCGILFAINPARARPARGLERQPCQYIRGQGHIAVGAADQVARRLSAEDFPVRRSATTS